MTSFSRSAKIVFIGAGSMSFGLAMLRDIFSNPALAHSTLTLVDVNEDALQRITKLAAALNQAAGRSLTIAHTTDRRRALAGADFVVNSIAVDRVRQWKLDFEVPRKYGIRHTLGENGGPGALFFTLRTLPIIFDIVRDMEELCPQALFINFSNPESRIVLALAKYSRIRAVGLCHGIFMAHEDVAGILGLAPEDISVWAAGLNHFQWLLQVRERQTGKDLYPVLRQKEKATADSSLPLTRRLFRAFGYWPSCSDDHLGEYLPYGWEAGEHGYDFAEDERERREQQEEIDAVTSGLARVPEEWLAPSGERGGAVIAGILGNENRFIESGVVYNQGAVPNLDADAAVEVPLHVDAAGVHPVSLGPLPNAIAKLLSIQVSLQQLSVEAAVRASKEIALQALLVDPVVNSADAAVKMLDELWEANLPHIRPCI